MPPPPLAATAKPPLDAGPVRPATPAAACAAARNPASAESREKQNKQHNNNGEQARCQKEKRRQTSKMLEKKDKSK